MVIDARIPMMGRGVNFLDSYSKGMAINQRAQQNAFVNRQAQMQERMGAAQMLARGVLSSPDKASAYNKALAQARRMGFDISAFPQEWGEDADIAMRMVASSDEDRTEFERLTSSLSREEARRALMIKLGMAPRAGADTPNALQQRAIDAGLTPGSPEWKKFMLEGGRMRNTRTVFGPDGNPVFHEGPAGTTPRPLREYEAKALQFHQRMTAAMPRVEAAENALVDNRGGPSLLDSIAENFGSVGNFAKSPEFQTYQAAAREWIAGLLRLDSGAAVPESEFTRYFSTFFFAPGDNETTRASKKAARQAAQDAIGMVAPPAPGGASPEAATAPAGSPAKPSEEAVLEAARRHGINVTRRSEPATAPSAAPAPAARPAPTSAPAGAAVGATAASGAFPEESAAPDGFPVRLWNQMSPDEKSAMWRAWTSADPTERRMILAPLIEQYFPGAR